MGPIHKQQQYTCPMHAEIIKDAPGKCPKCGMELVPLTELNDPHSRHVHKQKHTHYHDQPIHREHMLVNESGHDMNSHSGHNVHAHHAGMIEEYKKRFVIVLLLTIPIMALSPMIQHWLKVNWLFTGSSFILLVLSSIVYFYGGWPFLVGLRDEVKTRSLGMMTLVAVAISVAYLYSVAIVFGLQGMDFFWEWPP